MSRVDFRAGAVAFLDVLGWKGIWQQDRDAGNTMSALIQETRNKAQEISFPYFKRREFRGKDKITEVLSISDTIALFTDGNTDATLEIQAQICSWLLPRALEYKLPLRGAISFGEYSIKESIMLGYAVDEAASWHESTDWIGVVLAPSALVKCRKNRPQRICVYGDIPFKHRQKNLSLCVDWTFDDKTKLEKIILSKGPHTPSIASKYLNTLAFLDRKKSDPARR